MSWRRSPAPPSSQQPYNSAKSSRASTPNGFSRTRSAQALRRRGRKNRVSHTVRHTFRSRALDVTPLFTVDVAVRCVEVVNERMAWTAEFDGSIAVRSIPKGSELRIIPGREGVFCNCLLFVVKTGKVWTAFSDGFLRVYDVNTFVMENEFVQHNGAVECIAEMEGRVYTGGRDWKIYQWVPESYNYERQFSGHTNAVRCLCPYTGSTGAVLFTGGDDGMVKAWDPYLPVKQSNENNPCVHTFVGHTRGVWALELVSPNNQLWSGGEDTTIRVWDLQSLKCVTVLEHHRSPIACLTLVEHRVWSGDKHGHILLWDLKTLSPTQEISQQMRVEHRSVLVIRKMVSTISWKVWTTGSAGHIHCWNADSMPLLFDHDSTGEMLPHTDEENVRALERDNKSLLGELAKLTRQLESEYGRSRLEVFNHVQDKQLLMDTNDSLQKKLRKRRHSWSDGSSGAVEKRDRSSRLTSGSPPPRCVKSPTPASALSLVAGQTGEGVRGGMRSPPFFTRSVDCEDAVSITTAHKRFFPGNAWGDILPRNETELRVAFTREAAQALSLPEDNFQQISMKPKQHGLLTTVAVRHCLSRHSEDVQRHLDAHPFLDILNHYRIALEGSNKALKDALTHDQDETKSTRRSKSDNTNRRTFSRSVDREKSAQQANLNDELEKVKQTNMRLHTEIKQLSAQLATTNPPSHINLKEEYDALKSFVDGSLKPQISRLKRMNGEKDLDLRANEERIKLLLRDQEQLQKKLAGMSL
ncbi:hypothetical protein TraAM80_08870 [Trypanosoma rangeli]|uniref:Flagellar attachment zone protein 1 conserved domain-containing protein n=1 Tax=Trypanosoma rangeli TaxID=5698 RepID=A0A3R7N184_TRYRA|nr:uncharacterized protein TraAM80_08870 [Trypanosoma rangeli]RNE98348.1 hypothetical protein TraAM80_08870 [Trypanosoma rangeli]|eukprot:RNE98348.1 hypothetical protein TraAM80_08870 [Trypanosoma rangeli]